MKRERTQPDEKEISATMHDKFTPFDLVLLEKKNVISYRYKCFI
jgi:hypothetical protein